MSSISSTWLLETLYNADKPDAETLRIYKTLERYISDTREFYGCVENITDTIIRFKPLHDLADDCFFGVAFFSEYINHKNIRRGAPDVNFYSYTGKNAFSKTGWNGIAHRWDFWIGYVNENVWTGPSRYK